jgi:molecular chaperone DnaK (HSP70)
VANLIKRNQKVPADVTQQFYTLEHDQQNVLVQLMENSSLQDSEELGNSTKLSEGTLPLPPGMPADTPIEVTFKLNNQGRLEVTAIEPKSRRICQFQVQIEGVMSAEEVEASRVKTQALSVS